MKTTQLHRDYVVDNCKNKEGVGLSTKAINEHLMSIGLTKSQSNCVCRNQRKRLKLYVKQD